MRFVKNNDGFLETAADADATPAASDEVSWIGPAVFAALVVVGLIIFLRKRGARH